MHQMKQDSVIFQLLEKVKEWNGQTIGIMAIRKLKNYFH